MEDLYEGDLVTTNYHKLCKGAVYRIVRRFEPCEYEPEVMYIVCPPLPGEQPFAKFNHRFFKRWD